MSLTPSHRPTREWPLLLLTLTVVSLVCVSLWQGLAADSSQAAPFADWDAERWARLLLGPEQIACYLCFTWGAFILLSRYLELRRQRRAFDLGLLPTEEGLRILPEDARPLLRKVDEENARRGPFILANMIRPALGKLGAGRPSVEVSEAIRTQAEVDQGRLVTSMATVHYLAWAIPSLGFLGTVRGLAGCLTMAGSDEESTQRFVEQATRHLTVAFDCTLIALFLSLAIMFLIHVVQRDEEAFIIDCQQYCSEHLVNRLYHPEPGIRGKESGVRNQQSGIVGSYLSMTPDP
jgi:hypothetical protein